MSTFVERCQEDQESGGDSASVGSGADRCNTSPLSESPVSHHSPDQLSRRTLSTSPPALPIPALTANILPGDYASTPSSGSPEKPDGIAFTAPGIITQDGDQALAGEAAIDPSLLGLEEVIEVDLSKTAPPGDAALSGAGTGVGAGAGVKGTTESFIPPTQTIPWLPTFPLQGHSHSTAPAQDQGHTGSSSTDSPPWALQTSLPSLPGTQLPSSASESPVSPFPGVGGEWPGSFDGSMTDLGSYTSGATGVGGGVRVAGQGMSATSSESGYDGGSGAGGEGVQDVPPPKKKSHARKQPEGHIKRARNAFILFRKHITDSNLIPPSVEVKHQNISVVAAKMWKEARPEVRHKFQEQARLEKEEHQRKYPGYRYQPVFRRTDIIRRRVRKDPAEDEKVDAVAEALIKGKAGGALEKEIKDQLVARSEASESEAESSRGSRKRRQVGQLSKGAIRAQRAKDRTAQMRQNLLGRNLLSMSLYNAAKSRLVSSSNGYRSHPGAAAAGGHGLHHGMGYQMNYMPVGYDMEGRAIAMGGGGGGEGYAQDVYGAEHVPQHPGQETDMYRLPHIDGIMGMAPAGYEWQQPGMEYWDQPGEGAPPDMMPQQGGYGVPGEEYYVSGNEMEAVMHEAEMEYRLPPIIGRGGLGELSPERAPGDIIAGEYAANVGRSVGEKESPGMRGWARERQQTPSGHVFFSESLFDGALGSAGIQERGETGDELGMFDQAMEHAGEAAQW